jgi:hypothetical protein
MAEQCLAIMDYHMDRMSFGKNEGAIDTVLILVVHGGGRTTEFGARALRECIDGEDGELSHPQFEPQPSRKWEGAIS